MRAECMYSRVVATIKYVQIAAQVNFSVVFINNFNFLNVNYKT